MMTERMEGREVRVRSDVSVTLSAHSSLKGMKSLWVWVTMSCSDWSRAFCTGVEKEWRDCRRREVKLVEEMRCSCVAEVNTHSRLDSKCRRREEAEHWRKTSRTSWTASRLRTEEAEDRRGAGPVEEAEGRTARGERLVLEELRAWPRMRAMEGVEGRAPMAWLCVSGSEGCTERTVERGILPPEGEAKEAGEVEAEG